MRSPKDTKPGGEALRLRLKAAWLLTQGNWRAICFLQGGGGSCPATAPTPTRMPGAICEICASHSDAELCPAGSHCSHSEATARTSRNSEITTPDSPTSSSDLWEPWEESRKKLHFTSQAGKLTSGVPERAEKCCRLNKNWRKKKHHKVPEMFHMDRNYISTVK